MSVPAPAQCGGVGGAYMGGVALVGFSTAQSHTPGQPSAGAMRHRIDDPLAYDPVTSPATFFPRTRMAHRLVGIVGGRAPAPPL